MLSNQNSTFPIKKNAVTCLVDKVIAERFRLDFVRHRFDTVLSLGRVFQVFRVFRGQQITNCQARP